jgi:hypothetical protein
MGQFQDPEHYLKSVLGYSKRKIPSKEPETLDLLAAELKKPH